MGAIKRRAKRRLKNEFSSKKKSSHRNKSNLKKDYFENESIKVQLQHAFKSFGKWCSFPQEFEATREKITQDTNYYLQLTQRKEKHTKKRNNIANFYVTRNIILQSASCFQHFLLSKKKPFSQLKKKKKKKKKS